jgi:oxygen-independent coproporphyrinogen-3 oxidase
VRWQPALATAFVKALIREARFHASAHPGLEITSVYFGGGTPTSLGPQLIGVIDALRETFDVRGPVCLEAHPADLDQDMAHRLADAGVHAVSLGIESFHSHHLKFLGRHYAPEQAAQAVAWLSDAGLPSINVDLMFALPDETLEELEEDLAAADATGTGQITAYPLFTFPYTTLAHHRHTRGVDAPSFNVRRRMYYFLYDYLEKRGYTRASVWSFKRSPKSAVRFSSVTRQGYIGLGPGAGSAYLPCFSLNTFSVPAYLESVAARGHAVALEMPLTEGMAEMQRLYWHLYDTVVPDMSGGDEPNLSQRALFALLRLTGCATHGADGHVLTRRGAFWVHLAQNAFALRAVDRIWTAARQEPWPATIRF